MVLETREWSSCVWEVYSIYKEHGDRTKIKGTDNAHKRTLQAVEMETTISG